MDLVSHRADHRRCRRAGCARRLSDDVAHYQKLLARHARARAGRGARGRAGRRAGCRSGAFVSLLDRTARQSRFASAFAASSRSGGRSGATCASSSAARYGLELDHGRPPLVARPDDAPAPARPGRAARAALPRPQDPRRGALPLLRLGTLGRWLSASDPRPVRADERASAARPAQHAARRRQDGARRRRAPSGAAARAAQAGEFGDYSTNAAMLLRAGAGRAAARDRRAARRGARERLAGELERVEVAGPGFLNLFSPTAGIAPRSRDVLAAGERFGAGGATRRERILDRVRLRQPDRPAASPPAAATRRTATRSRGSSPSTATTSRASTTSTTPARRCASSASRCARARAARRCPRAATRATTSPSWRRRSTGRRGRPRRSSRARPSSSMLARIRATLERFGVGSTAFFSERTLHEGDPSAVEPGARGARARPGTRYRSEGALWLRTTTLRRRQGPRAASAPTASRPTSPPTSPTTRTSASAASSAS